MRQFNFRLEKLLEMKKHSEKERSLELAEVTGRYIKIEQDIESLKGKKSHILKTRFIYAENNVTSLIQDEHQMAAISSKIKKLEKDLEKIAVERELYREKYMNAMKERKVLEKLKDKKAVEYKKREASKEARTLDDLAGANISGRQEV